ARGVPAHARRRAGAAYRTAREAADQSAGCPGTTGLADPHPGQRRRGALDATRGLRTHPATAGDGLAGGRPGPGAIGRAVGVLAEMAARRIPHQRARAGPAAGACNGGCPVGGQGVGSGLATGGLCPPHRQPRYGGLQPQEFAASVVEQVLPRVRAMVDARLEVKEWAPAWRLVACARLIDSHGMAAYNLSSSPDWLYEQLLQMSWQMSPEAPTDTEDALRALDEADQALSALARKDPQADATISIEAEHLSQAQLWRHACHLLDIAEEHGADATPARRDLDDKILQEVLAEPQGALLDAMGTPADAALFEQAVGRIKSSYV